MKIKNKKLTIRFYEELNDFLPKSYRKKRFVHNFIDRASVKDLIESLGVPHTEVDLILINGKSVSFDKLISDNDDISVYPVFESFDIKSAQHLRAKPLRKTKFVCDVHLGGLVTNLRMLGIDAFYENDLTDQIIIDVSIKERRTILTRDLGILKRKEVTHGYFVRETNPEKQTLEVLKRFQLENEIRPFTRCLECGEKLYHIAKSKIMDRLPVKAKQNQNKFYICKKCNKIFWKGSHYDNMRSFIKSSLKLDI